jgi:ketosteroid isomerase-like protein
MLERDRDLGSLQSNDDHCMEPRIVAAASDEVVTLWPQKASTADGRRLDSPVLTLYRFRDGKLARAQMFHFDTTTVVNFLCQALPTLR